MSEPKLISPLLDGFVIGDAISDHDGVRCYPAMREDSDDKYIVKVITIPASDTQLDALLLTGAYSDAQAAQVYFESLVNDIENEIQVLQHFAKLDGFCAYEGYQVVAHEDGVGFDVYLLGSYKRSLARYFKSKPMTHLGAVNLGIDLCTAMTACRQAGCLYIDLKPENIFITDDSSYQIGDLGFIPMSSLKYATVPDKYRSSYTAPELDDHMAELNTSVDIYAIGLVLYQAYNNGALPFEGKAPSEVLHSPLYADYEMAEIILKACAPDPADRWEDPKLLGQALVAYMQRNGANDTPIVPPSIPTVEQEVDAPAATEPEVTEAVLEETSAEPDELAFVDDLESEDILEAVEMPDELPDDLAEILAQAEELLAHELPAPAVAPEAVEIRLPEPAASEETDTNEFDEVLDEEIITDEQETNVIHNRKPRRVFKTILAWVIWLAVIAGIVFGGYYYYSNIYLQNVSEITITGVENTITVSLVTDVDNSLLSVVCTDTYGTTKTKPVVNNSASFEDLNPGSQYTVHVQISGFHKLTGNTSGSYATPPETNILSFTGTIGTEDGSVILSFTADGQDSDTWNIAYNAEGEEERVVTFTGHTTTITDLTVGKEYTFHLISGGEAYLVGNTELRMIAPRLVFAENLAVTAYDGANLTVSWDTPTDVVVNSWNVRCYNDSGYDVSMTVQDCTAIFANVDTSAANTIEVTAEGMNQCSRTFITANPISITGITGNNDALNELTFQWDYVGTAPEEGWLLVYSIEDSNIEEVIPCSEAKVSIIPPIPGATYHMTIQAANGATLFGGRFVSTAPDAVAFTGYDTTAEDMTFSMCAVPDVEDWELEDLEDADYKNTFAVGEKAGFLVSMDVIYDISYDEIVSLFVIRDSAGKIVSAESQTRQWIEMWHGGYCELDIPSMPQTAGNYTMDVYFNGASATHAEFTIE